MYGPSHERQPLEDALVEAVGRALARLAADDPATAVYRPVKASRPDGWQLDDPHGLVVVTGFSVRVLSVAGFDKPWSDKPLLVRRQRVGDLKEQLFAAFDVAQGLGGTHSRAAVLGTDTSPSARDEVTPMWADIGPLTQPDDLPDRDGRRRRPSVASDDGVRVGRSCRGCRVGVEPGRHAQQRPLPLADGGAMTGTVLTSIGLNPSRVLRVASALRPDHALLLTSANTEHLVQPLHEAAEQAGLVGEVRRRCRRTRTGCR